MPDKTPAAAAFDLAIVVSQQQQRYTATKITLDALLDMYNDLTDWCTDTEFEDAGLQVMAIMENHYKRRLQAVSPESTTQTA